MLSQQTADANITDISTAFQCYAVAWQGGFKGVLLKRQQLRSRQATRQWGFRLSLFQWGHVEIFETRSTHVHLVVSTLKNEMMANDVKMINSSP